MTSDNQNIYKLAFLFHIMKKIELIRMLEKYPLFTFNEFVRITGNGVKYCRTHIYRLKKEKLIFEIEKGKYTVHENPFLFASLISFPSYISFWTALRFYNLTDQLPIHIMIASKKSRKEIDFLGTKIKFYKIKHFWGYNKTRYEKFDIFMAEPEKCLVDSILMKLVPLNEIAKAIGSKEINLNKLKEFAIKTKNKSLIKRVGFLIEQNGANADELSKHIDYNYIRLDAFHKKKGEKNKKWRIINNLNNDFN